MTYQILIVIRRNSIPFYMQWSTFGMFCSSSCLSIVIMFNHSRCFVCFKMFYSELRLLCTFMIFSGYITVQMYVRLWGHRSCLVGNYADLRV